MFQALAETTAAAIFVQRENRILYVNRAAEAISGYTRAELLALDVWQLLPPDERDRGPAVYAARIRGDAVAGPPRREQQVVTKSGDIRWMDVSAGRIDWDGAPALLGTAFDVSDRHRAEGDRQRDERRYRALVEHASDVVFVFDAAGVITYTGPSIERVLGHPPSVMEQHDVLDLVHPDDQALCRGAVRTLLSDFGNTIRIQYRVRHGDGTWRWMEGIGTNLLDEPGIGGVIVNARDVTDWRAAENHLAESEARFALAVDGAKDGVWDWQAAQGELFISPRMREMLALGLDDTAAALQRFLDNVHPDDYAQVRTSWQAHLQGDASHYEAEYRYRMPDGAYRWFLARARTVRDLSGIPTRLVGSLTDTTARKAAEDEARQRQAELAHVLRVGAMNEMAASIAHELNQPLAAIVNYARGCARRLSQTTVAPDLLEVLDRIAAEALRAGEVVRSLKRVVRKEPPRESRLDLVALARDAVHLVRSEATAHGIGVRMEIADGVGAVHGDGVQIQQVVLNLLRNAIEAIARRPGLVEVHIAPAGDGVRLSVTDSGTGVPTELLDRIFAPFFSTKASGLGMGLSISRTIVEAHGGRLWADATPDAGATFSFTLPARRP